MKRETKRVNAMHQPTANEPELLTKTDVAKLLQVSGLLEPGIDPRQVRPTLSDLPRLLETARAIEAQQLAAQERDPKRAAWRVPV